MQARRDEDGFVSAHVQHQDGKGKPIVRVKLGKTSDLEAAAAQGDGPLLAAIKGWFLASPRVGENIAEGEYWPCDWAMRLWRDDDDVRRQVRLAAAAASIPLRESHTRVRARRRLGCSA